MHFLLSAAQRMRLELGGPFTETVAHDVQLSQGSGRAPTPWLFSYFPFENFLPDLNGLRKNGSIFKSSVYVNGFRP